MDGIDLVVEQEQLAEVHYYLNLVVAGYLLDDADYYVSNSNVAG